jgi:hypothetical protein
MHVRFADMQLQCGYSAALALLTTHKAPLQCQTVPHDGAMLQTMRDMTERQERAHSTLKVS